MVLPQLLNTLIAEIHISWWHPYRNIHPNKTNLVLGGRTFKNSGRLAFNSLPSRIKEASSLAIFKRLLKGHFI